MFRHDDISEDMEVIPGTHLFKRSFEEVRCPGKGEMLKPAVTTEGQEVGVSATLIANQTLSYFGILRRRTKDGLLAWAFSGFGKPTSQREMWGTLIC